MTKMVRNNPNHHRQFLSSSISENRGACGGPSCMTGANEVCRSSMTMSDIYDVAGVAAPPAGHCSGGAALVRTLQPFDTSHTALKSPGVMAASLGFPFTIAQWKELERQAMIYKYMMASVPVPSDLLFPLTTNFSDPSVATSHSSLGRGSIFNLRFTKNTDPEPGRCRRTDGKKWRCSRDVAPDQKYCERHMHRGRPRSRKPVEAHADFNSNNNSKKARLNNGLRTTGAPTVSKPVVNTNGSPTPFLGSSAQTNPQIPMFLDKSSREISPFESMVSASSYKEPRTLDWMVKGAAVPVAISDQQKHHLMETKIGLATDGPFCNTNASIYQNHYEEEPPNLNSYTNFDGDEDQQHNECVLFLNPDVVSLDKSHSETARDFIDAWSNPVTEDNSANVRNKNSVPSNGTLSLSSLTLSMASHKTISEEMGHIQMGLGVTESESSYDKPQIASWLTPSWVAPTPGGPLAEVLRPGTVTADSNASSPIVGKGTDLGSPQTTTVSSPSGVLQKTLASLSDSSGSTSPTFLGSSAKPEIAFQWLN